MMIAPWNTDVPEKKKDLPPILQNLKGEWPCKKCVNFELYKVYLLAHRERWRIYTQIGKKVSIFKCLLIPTVKWEESEGYGHGPSSNLHWKLVSQEKHGCEQNIFRLIF